MTTGLGHGQANAPLFAPSRPAPGWRWAPPLAATLGIGAVVLRLLSPYLTLPPCLFRTLTGWPCLTCGGTRCLLALASGRPAEAFWLNPLVTIGAFALMAAGLLGIVERAGGQPLPRPAPRHRRLLLAVALALALANWGYLVWVTRGGA